MFDRGTVVRDGTDGNHATVMTELGFALRGTRVAT